jgi:hypothetical protein
VIADSRNRTAISDHEDILRYLAYLFAAVLVAAFLSLNGVVTEIVPLAITSAFAAPAPRGENALPEFLPARFRDVQVWDERPQPEAF